MTDITYSQGTLSHSVPTNLPRTGKAAQKATQDELYYNEFGSQLQVSFSLFLQFSDSTFVETEIPEMLESVLVLV